MCVVCGGWEGEGGKRARDEVSPHDDMHCHPGIIIVVSVRENWDSYGCMTEPRAH